MWYNSIIYSSLSSILESLGGPKRSPLGLLQLEELPGFHSSLPANPVYLVRCIASAVFQLCSEYVAFPLSQKHIPVGACTTESLSMSMRLLSYLGICNAATISFWPIILFNSQVKFPDCRDHMKSHKALL